MSSLVDLDRAIGEDPSQYRVPSRQHQEPQKPNDILSPQGDLLDSSAQIPGSLKVRALRAGVLRFLRRGSAISKPLAKEVFTLGDAMEQLTREEEGLQVRGRDGSGRRVKPFNVYVDGIVTNRLVETRLPDGTLSKRRHKKGDLFTFSTSHERGARPSVRARRWG